MNTLQEIENLLIEGSRDNLVLNKGLLERLNLPFDVFEDSGLQDVIIRRPEVVREDGQVSLTGVTSLLNLSELGVAGVFIIAENSPQFSLTLPLPKTWSFRHSFPDLPTYLDFSPQLLTKGGSESFFYKLQIDDGQLILSTRAYRDDQLAADIGAGLNIIAQVDISGPLAFLSPILGNQRTLRLQGLVQKDGASNFFARIPVNLQLGAFLLTEVALELSGPLFTSNGETPSSGMRLHGTANVQDKTIRLFSDLNIGSSYVELQSYFADMVLPSLTELGQFIGQDDIAAFLPELPATSARISLDWLILGLANKTPKLQKIGVGLSTDMEWEIIKDRLHVAGLAFEVFIYSPLNARTREVSCAFRGDLHLADKVINVTAEFPDFNLMGVLPEGDSINLSEFLKQWDVPVDGLPKTLTITALYILANPKRQAFSLQIGLSGLWEIAVGSKRLVLEELTMQMDYAAGAVASVISGTATLADFQLAAIASQSGEGWVIEATLTDVTLSALLNSLFDDVPLPAEVPNFGFSTGNLSITPKTGRLTFTASSADEWTIPVGVTGVGIRDIRLTVNKPAANQKANLTIGGTLRIGAAAFNVGFSSPGEFVLTGDLPQINLSELLQEFCGSEIIRDLPVPANVLSAALTSLRFTIAPKSQFIAVAAASKFGPAEINIKKVGTQWGFSAAFCAAGELEVLSAVARAFRAGWAQFFQYHSRAGLSRRSRAGDQVSQHTGPSE